VTRWAGPFSVFCETVCDTGDEQTVWVTTAAPASFAAALSTRITHLRSDTHHDLELETKARDKAPKSSPVRIRVEAQAIGGVGAYKGSVPIQPGVPGGTTLDADVHVHDLFLWPLLAVLLAAWAGGYLVQRYEQKRRRDLIEVALDRAESAYPAEDPPGLYSLKQTLADRRAAIVAQVKSATSEAELKAATDEVNDVAKSIATWEATRAEQQQLTELDKRPTREFSPSANEDTAALIGMAAKLPDDPDDLLARLTRHRRVLTALVELEIQWDQLDDDARGANRHLSPEAVYRADRRAAAERDDHDTERTIARIRRAQRRVVAKAFPPIGPSPAAPAPAAALGGAGQAAAAGFTLEPAEGIGAGQPGTSAPPPRRTPEQIVAGLKRWDFVIAAATAVVTAVAYTIVAYTKGDFGTVWDYAAAIAAGFLGQAVYGGAAINWNRFPRFRSYKGPEATS
jgi:hypothetical protein